jgi:hypothetical protein
MAKTLHEEYADALATSRARQETAAIERSARVALRALGWAADREQLEAWAESIPARRRAAVVEQALQLRAQATEPERRYTAEEREAFMAARQRGGRPPMKLIPEAKRAEIREFIVQRRRADPKVSPRAVCEEVEHRFGVELSPQNFSATYWMPAGRKLEAFRAESERQPGRAAGPLPTGGVATAPAVAPAVASPNGGTPTPPSAPGGSPLADPLKLGPIHVITVGRGQLRVLIDYTGPAPTVFALVAAAAAVLAEREAA